MGLLDNMFGGKQNYPDLDPNSSVKNQVDEVEAPLEELVSQVNDPLEIVPCGERTYVFIGKPPKRFGVAWIENGEVKNFTLLAKEQGIGAADMQTISDRLREAYEQFQDAERYQTTVAGREVVVTPERDLGHNVQGIIAEALA